MAWTKAVRKRIWKRSDGKCFYCGADHDLDDYGDEWEVGHVRSRHYGGSDHVRNLVVVCVGCNRSQGKRFSFGDLVRNFVGDR